MRQTLFLFSFRTYTTTKSLSLFRAFIFVLLLFFFLCLCFCFCFCLQVWFGLVCLCPTLLLLHSELQHLTSYARFLNSKSSRTIHSLNKNRSKIKKKKKLLILIFTNSVLRIQQTLFIFSCFHALNLVSLLPFLFDD
jgi:hypothetical protein